MTACRHILGLGTLAALLSGCSFHLAESNLIHPMPTPAPELSPLQSEFPGYRFSEHTLEVADGTRLYSLRLLRDDARATVLYFGGNGYRIGAAARFSALGYSDIPVNLILVDHRGYGASTGEPTMAAMLDDALQVYDRTLADPAIAAGPLIVHGQSLGSFMAGHVADHRRLDGLVLESSATSAEDWMEYGRSRQSLWKRMLVRRIVIADTLAGRGNLPVAARLDEPVLFVVGADDTTTPPAFSERLYAETPLPDAHKHLLVVPGRGHNRATLSEDFREAMTAFVNGIAERHTAP